MKVTAILLAASAGVALAAPSGGKWRKPKWHPGKWKPKHHVPKPHWPTHVLPPPHYPTKTKSSSGTVAPTATALPPVDSEALQASITEANLAAKAQDLEDIAYASPNRNRVMGSEGHNNTVAYLVESIEALGDYYTVYTQPFIALYSNSDGSLTVDGVETEVGTFTYAPSGNIEADLVAVPNLGCNATDYSATELAGKIALISRGTCNFGLKVAFASTAGATGVIIYNNVEGPANEGTLGAPPRPEGDYIPSLSVSQADGQAYVASLAAGETLSATLIVNAVQENITTFNVIAETKSGDKNNTLVIGAHSDSVFKGPGINDDGSGSIGILEVAEQLIKYSVKNSVRIAWWSGEEFGLLGSYYYTENLSAEEAAKIRLYLNFDMIASPNYVYALYDGDGSGFNITGPPGSAEAEHFFEDWFASQGLDTIETAFDGRSDYGGFLDIGVASGGTFTGAEGIKTEEEAELFGGEAGVAYDINYHGPGDNFTNLNFEAFVVNTKAIAASVAYYATSFDSLPPKNTTVARRSVDSQKAAPRREGHALNF